MLSIKDLEAFSIINQALHKDEHRAGGSANGHDTGVSHGFVNHNLHPYRASPLMQNWARGMYLLLGRKR